MKKILLFISLVFFSCNSEVKSENPILDFQKNLVKNGITGLKAKKRKIGEFLIGSNWVEVDYLSCTQRFWFKENKNFWHGWPDDKKCFWTRKKEFFVKRYNGELTIN